MCGNGTRIWVKSLVTADAPLLATLVDDEFTLIGPDAQAETRDAYLAGYEGMAQAGIAFKASTCTTSGSECWATWASSLDASWPR